MILTWTLKIDTEDNLNRDLTIGDLVKIQDEIEDTINKRGGSILDSDFDKED